MIFLEIVAILSCVAFAGVAVYINVGEHPARLECGVELASIVFGPSYRRAAAMQATLAITASVAGISLGIFGGNSLWLVGTLFIFFVVPFTLIIIMPVNQLLLSPSQVRAPHETGVLLKKWGMLHLVRSVSSSIAAILYVYLGVAN